MPFEPKTWVDAPDGYVQGDAVPEGATPVHAAALNDLETRVNAALLELADSGGVELLDVADIFTPAVGFALASSQTYYRVGGELIVPELAVQRAASTALTVAGDVTLGTLDEEFWPMSNGDGDVRFCAYARTSDFNTFTPCDCWVHPANGGVHSVPHAAADAAAGVIFVVPAMRFLLASAVA